MRIASDRWRLIASLAVMLVAALYFVAGAFARHTTHDLAWASLTLWNVGLLVAMSFWWWPRRRPIEALIMRRPRRARMLLLSAILASALASGGLLAVGVDLLEQNRLALQVLGGVLLAIVPLVLPGWAWWFYRWARRAWQAAGSGQASVALDSG